MMVAAHDITAGAVGPRGVPGAKASGSRSAWVTMAGIGLAVAAWTDNY
jgi:hypothetical protein